jgi:hypothetical protein
LRSQKLAKCVVDRTGLHSLQSLNCTSEEEAPRYPLSIKMDNIKMCLKEVRCDVLDCTELAENITMFCRHSNDPSGYRTSGEFLHCLWYCHFPNEQIKKPEGVLPVLESEPACSHSYDSYVLPHKR